MIVLQPWAFGRQSSSMVLGRKQALDTFGGQAVKPNSFQGGRLLLLVQSSKCKILPR